MIFGETKVPRRLKPGVYDSLCIVEIRISDIACLSI